MPLLDAIVGTSSNGLYGAIFDVDVMPEEDLFGTPEEDERPALRSVASSTRLRGSRSRGRTPEPGVPTTNIQSPPTSPVSPTRTRGTSDASPMRRQMRISTDLLDPGQPGDPPSIGMMSPLVRLFTGDSPIRGRTTSMGAGASLRKVERLLEDIKQLPVNKFTEEMRELQVRFIFLLILCSLPPPLGGGIYIQSLFEGPFGPCIHILRSHASLPFFF